MREIILNSQEDKPKAIYAIRDVDVTKPVKVTIEEYDPSKTNPQLKLYWKWIDEAVAQTGGFKHGIDKSLREYHLEPIIYKKVNGQEDEYYKTVGQLGKKEMSEYMDKVYITLSDYGVGLTNPDELHET